MTTALTVDDIWKLFQETNRLFQESERKWDKSTQEWKERIQETERIMQENHAKTEQVMQENHAKTEQVMQENHAKTERTVDRVSLKVDQVSKQIGNLGGRWGEFVEGLIAPSCIAMFTERGIQVDEVFSRAKKTIDGERVEIDLLVANTVAAVLVEVKSHLEVEDVRHHLNRLEKFKTFFPRYADCQVYGAVAGIVIAAKADQFAMNKGLFVIVQSGETVKLANEQAFNPRVW